MMWPNIHSSLHLLLTLKPHLLQDRLDDLVTNVCDVCPPADRADRVHEAHLMEARLRQAHANLPPVGALFVDLGHTLAGQQVKVTVVSEVLHVELVTIQKHAATLRCGTGHIVDALRQQGNNVFVQVRHAELRQVWLEGDAGEGLFLGSNDLRLALDLHVAFVQLAEPVFAVASLHFELRGEDVGKLGTVAVPASHHLARRVVVVVTGQQVAKHQLWDIDLLLLVQNDRETPAVIPDCDEALLLIDLYFDGVHALWVPHEVVCGIHQDFIEDFVKSRYEANLSMHHATLHTIENPEVLNLGFCRTHIGVRS
mmetsp:Transcript_72088/g.168882  ORF Transcript_72088/g.168882 Transcript_72088/m.168882 type:complete len:311 (-) Transcript_72088:153-1085(-)